MIAARITGAVSHTNILNHTIAVVIAMTRNTTGKYLSI